MDYKEIKNNLTWLQKIKQKMKYVKLAGKINNQEVKEITEDLLMEQRRNRNKRNMLELKDNLKQLKLEQEIELLKTKGMLELKQASSKCTKVNRLESRGHWFKIANWCMVFISCVTSMLGFGMIESGLDAIPLMREMTNGKHLNCLVLGIIFLGVQALTSLFVASINDIKTFFDSKKNYILIVAIAFVYMVSIYSNYGFWITLSKSKFVAGFYSFLIDAFTILTSGYSEKFISQDSKKIQEFLLDENEKITLENTQNLLSKTDENIPTNTNSKTTSIEPKKGDLDVLEVSKKSKKNDGEKVKKFTHTSNSKGIKNYKELEKIIDEKIQPDETITPKKVNLSNNKNYYTWIKKCNNVTKNEDGKWTRKNTIAEISKEVVEK